MAKKREKTRWTVERKYKNLYSPLTCVQTIIRRHIAWESKKTQHGGL